MTVTTPTEVVAESNDSGDGLSSFLATVLSEKTNAHVVVVPVTPGPTGQAVALDAVLKSASRALRRLGVAARAAAATLRSAASWLAIGPRAAASSASSWRRRAGYRGGHRVARNWLGRERSTAEQTGYRHRTYRLAAAKRATLTAPPSPEGELPNAHYLGIYWVGWLERVQEVMRAHDEALHPTREHRFICS